MSVEISVIITTFNRPNNLKRAIESIIKQSFVDWELIVVDDNNPKTEGRVLTESIMEYYCNVDSRILYIKHEYNRNGAAARNTGIKYATGKYITFLDDDDYYLDDKLSKQYNIIEKSDQLYGGIYSGCNFIRNNKIVNKLDNVKSGNFLKETLECRFQMGSGSNLFIKSNVIKELGGFDENFNRHQDYEFLVRFFEKYKLIGINDILFNVDQSDKHSNIPNTEKLYNTKIQYLEKYKYIIDKMSIEDRNDIYHLQLLELCESAIRGKEYKQLKNYIKQATEYKNIKINRALKLCALFIYTNISKYLKLEMLRRTF